MDEVKCEKIQRARESGHETGRGKVRPILKFHEKKQYNTGLSLRVPLFLAECGAIENLDFVWED